MAIRSVIGSAAFLFLLLAACDRLPVGGDRASTSEDERPAVGQTEVLATAEEPNGHEIFERNCSVCHASDGDGSVGPALAGNRNLASGTYVVARIQLGGGGMPPFARLLSSEEIAATASYIRNSWQNEFGAVSGEQVDLQWYGLRRGMRYGTFALD